MAAVNHQNVVPVYASGRMAGKAYLVMQYMERGAVKRFLHNAAGPEGRPMSREAALRCIQAAASGLRAALQAGVVHHDVKPGNILEDDSGRIKVADFGVAELLRTGQQKAGESRPVWGSPHYMSPEKARGEEEDWRGDVFSLGATLFHLIGGHPPYEGKSAQAIMEARLHLPPPDMRSVCPEIDDDTAAFVKWLMAKEPGERPADYEQILERLNQLRSARKVRIASSEMKRVSGKRNGGTGSRGECGHPMRRIFDVLIAVACLVLLLLGVVAFRAGNDWETWFRGCGRATRVPPPRVESGALNQLQAVDADERARGNRQDGPTRLPARFRKRRPRPADFDFEGHSDRLREYVRTLPEEYRRREAERVEQLVPFKDYLIRLMKYLPYDAPHGVLLRNGDKVAGSVPFANEQQLVVRLAASGQLEKVGWDQIAVRQICRFMEFYIQKRVDMKSSVPASSKQAKPVGKQTGMDYLRLALICDWYGLERQAAAYSRIAVERNPDIEQMALRLVPRRS